MCTLEHATKAQGRRYSSTLSLTSALDGVVNATPRLLYPPEMTIVYEAGWASWAVWGGGGVAENLAPYRDSIPGTSSP